MIPAPGWTPTNAEYHAVTDRWSSSRLAVFRERPWEAYRRWVVGEEMEPDPSPAMQIGAAVSQCVTDPPLIGQHVVRVEVKGRNSKAYRQAAEAYPERVVLTAPEYDRVQGMLNALHSLQTPAARAARALLLEAPGHGEYGLRWEETNGIPCQAKLDRLVELHAEPTIVELKTAIRADPRGFAAAAERFRYDCQDAFYRRGVAHVLGITPAVYHVVLHSEWPYEVAVYPAGDDFLQRGDDQVQDDLARLARCLASEDETAWRQPWETAEVLPVLRPPRWARRETMDDGGWDDDDDGV